ncbi:hypothetical protein JX265_010613 [Neoarthrinium moseri]|uniref:Beta-glucuronidase C-terminal domain-containing protein n=1 Tax=Neoarthrinium moseri TaxID=1658444 RepID=A0A9Q0ALI8_9PEZI|nr:hypothetical protein JX265_010613 [Neoarthrinium moseri]
MAGLRLYLGAAAAVASRTLAAVTVTYPVPSTTPSNSVELDSAPVGVSMEFFMWPSYMTNISIATDCLKHFDELYGKKTPTRIGGTTQDRATYDPDFDGYVSYHVDHPLDAPMTLTYGPKFFDLISAWGAETTLGFNRGDNNFTNTMEAALTAQSRAGEFLLAIELGNEPDLYYLYWNKPVATAPWNETQEGANAAQWAQAFIDSWDGEQPILSAGVYGVPLSLQPDGPNMIYLVSEAYNETVKAGTKVYCAHAYALSTGTDLQTEMNHIRTASDISQFKDDVALVNSIGRDHIIGEAGFHGQDVDIDATLGSAVQMVDKTLLATSIGLKQIYYHQGTINQAYFNWWSDDQVEAPFYGGYFAALALSGGDHIIASDNGTDSYAQYIIYKDGSPFKAVLVNTDYYSGTGDRNQTTFTLTGLSCSKTVKTLRMTAPSSDYTTTADTSVAQQLTIGGRYFSNKDCAAIGEEHFEEVKTSGGKASFTVGASEALIVYL